MQQVHSTDVDTKISDVDTQTIDRYSKVYKFTRPQVYTVATLAISAVFLSLRVEFSLKTDSGYPKDARVSLFTMEPTWNPLHYKTARSAHHSPPSPIPEDTGMEGMQVTSRHAQTHGHVWTGPSQSKGHQVSIVNRIFVCKFKVLARTESSTSEYSTTSQFVRARLCRLWRVKFVLDVLRWGK